MAVIVEDLGDRRTYEAGELPLSIGCADDADVRLPGDPALGIAAFVGLTQGRYYIQPAPGRDDVRIEGEPVTGSRWLADGEGYVLGETLLTVALRDDVLTLSAELDPDARVTAPPMAAVGAEAQEIGAGIADDGETIAPTARRQTRAAQAAKRPAWKAPAAIAGVSVLLAFLAWFLFTVRAVEVTVTPLPETLAIEGGLMKLEIGGVYLLRPGEYRVRATLAEYHDLDSPITVTEERNQDFSLRMDRLPDLLSVTVANLDAAEVSIDGETVGGAPLAEFPLEQGRHRLEVAAERYKPYVEDLDLAGGGNEVLRELSLVPDWANITFASEPPGAEVLVDGEARGETPDTIEIASGVRELVVRLDGHKPWRQQLLVEAEVDQVLPSIVMEPADGVLRVRSTPAGASVLVDGEFRGRTPLDVYLPPGRGHRVQVARAGYRPASQSYRLASGETRTASFRLTALTGIVEIEATPEDALLSIDGEPAGRAAGRYELTVTDHVFEVSRDGYVPVRFEVKPDHENLRRVRVELLTPLEAEMSRYAQRITTAVGGELVLVPPGEFVIGVPAGTPGRRSNESARRVEITRPFYIGTAELTNKEFREFSREHLSGVAGGFGLEADTQPVARVTWQRAAEFCNWLSRREGLPAAYRVSQGRHELIRPLTTGYRLPTEAEWVWAGRYAAQDSTPPRYPWGENMPPTGQAGNFADASAATFLPQTISTYNDGYPVSSPVGRFPANELGLTDIGGNVAEWVSDYYRIYGSGGGGTEKDPLGPTEGGYHVIRGSSWMHASLTELRQTFRDYGNRARPDVGFRIARSAR